MIDCYNFIEKVDYECYKNRFCIQNVFGIDINVFLL